jgi:hypothetical protein
MHATWSLILMQPTSEHVELFKLDLIINIF